MNGQPPKHKGLERARKRVKEIRDFYTHVVFSSS